MMKMIMMKMINLIIKILDRLPSSKAKGKSKEIEDQEQPSFKHIASKSKHNFSSDAQIHLDRISF